MSRALLLSCFAVSLELSLAADWPNWRGPDRDGISREKLPLPLPDALPVLWKQNVGIGFSSIVVVGDRVLTMGNESDRDSVWCLDATTGDVLWRHAYDCALDPLYYEGGPGATPTVHERSVYTLSKKGHVFRLDLETGKVIWSRDLPTDHGIKLPEWSFAGSPLVENDRVLLNVGRGGTALSAKTGETLWLPDTETSGYATPLPYSRPGAEVTHLLFSAKSLLALNAETGEPAWEFPWRCSRDVNAADPVLVGDRIVLSNSNGTVALLPRPGGEAPEVVWEQRDMKWYFNPGVLVGDHLYSIHGTTHRPTELVCVDAGTGEIVWAEEGFGSGGLIASDGHVIVFDLGKLTIFPASPTGFEPILEQTILEGKCWTAPTLANGRIYCRNAEGALACVALP